MKIIVAVVFLLSAYSVKAQNFPADWLGHWKGELNWYQGANKEPKKVPMQLSIQPTDSSHRFSWNLTYGADAVDTRPYTLMAVDSSKGHWRIDENNGIVLDQYRVADKLSGAFTVQSSTIINNYWLENGQLHVEFYNISARPVAVTGLGTNESPSVSSYQVKSYQKAILSRSK